MLSFTAAVEFEGLLQGQNRGKSEQRFFHLSYSDFIQLAPLNQQPCSSHLYRRSNVPNLFLSLSKSAVGHGAAKLSSFMRYRSNSLLRTFSLYVRMSVKVGTVEIIRIHVNVHQRPHLCKQHSKMVESTEVNLFKRLNTRICFSFFF